MKDNTDFLLSALIIPKHRVGYDENGRNVRIAELKRMSEIITTLEESNLDSKTLKMVIEEMFPGFGDFAISGF